MIVQVAVAAEHETVLAYDAPEDIKMGDQVELPYFWWQNDRIERRPHGVVVAFGRGHWEGSVKSIVSIERPGEADAKATH